MRDQIKVSCVCGKSLVAESKLAGKRAKCPNCGSVVQIPIPKSVTTAQPRASGKQPAPAATERSRTSSAPFARGQSSNTASATPALSTKSIWDEDADYDLAHSEPVDSASDGQSAVASPPRPSSGNLRVWIFIGAFLAYCALAWAVSLASPIASVLVIMPVFVIGTLVFMFGCVWYFLVLLRDDPGHAAIIFFGVLLAFVGMRASTAGYMSGRMRRGRLADPRHAGPLATMKFGFAGLAVGIGAVLIVGIILGRWTGGKLKQRRNPFDDPFFNRPRQNAPLNPPDRRGPQPFPRPFERQMD
jgi:hypothetical protein